MTTTGIVNMELVEEEVQQDEDLKKIIEERKRNTDEKQISLGEWEIMV